MKFSSILLAALFPSSIAAAGGLKGAERKLLTNEEQTKIDACVDSGLCSGPPQFNTGGMTTADARGFWNNTNIGLDALEAVYDGFCLVCSVSAIVNADNVFCILCDFDFDGDDVDGNDPDIPDIPSICFSEVATVQVENVGSVTMKNLQVGASILTASGVYEQVYAWGHRNPTKAANFLQFETDSGANLEMTSGHMVFLEGKANPIRADSVKVGDVLQGNTVAVTKIQTIQREGVYTPLTPSGTVVVDGITASTYVSLQKNGAEYVVLQGGFEVMSWQQLIHLSLSPFRMMTMGVSSTLGNLYTEEGIPHYASYGMDFLLWLNNQNILVQGIAFVVSMAIFGASMIMENTFGASLAPLAMAAGAGAYVYMKNSGVSYKIKSV